MVSDLESQYDLNGIYENKGHTFCGPFTNELGLLNPVTYSISVLITYVL